MKLSGGQSIVDGMTSGRVAFLVELDAKLW
jgi:hypothetical protein